MHLKDYAFGKLPFSDLFKTYVNDFESLAAFYESNPFAVDSIKKRAQRVDFEGDREQVVSLLQAFNEPFDLTEPARKNIKRFKEKDALAIVTGQQLGIYGGPLFTMFKTLTVLHLSRRLEQALDRPVIPVFWLADEDHDYDEIRALTILSNDKHERFSLPGQPHPLPPVSDIAFPDELENLRRQLKSTLIETDFSDDLWQLLDACFKAGSTFKKGFGQFISRLFSKHGLVLAGSNDQGIKGFTKESLLTAVREADVVRDVLEEQSQKLARPFHQQVTLYDSHLFYLNDAGNRIKIHHNEQWQTDDGRSWQTKELLDEIEHHPERFSPDVFLRPVLQDHLLPTLGYAAGPGEMAYYGQLKSFYRCFDKEMPVIFPRFSGTFFEPAIDRIFHELPFELSDYARRIEDLETAFVKHHDPIDTETVFDSWKQEIESIASPHIKKIATTDATLEGAAEKVQAHYSNELDKLKDKVYRAIKKREHIQLNRIRRTQENLFPQRNLQERTISGIYYMNKFGLDIWDRLLDEMDEAGLPNSHTLIYL